jgi:hypothetical protein
MLFQRTAGNKRPHATSVMNPVLRERSIHNTGRHTTVSHSRGRGFLSKAVPVGFTVWKPEMVWAFLHISVHTEDSPQPVAHTAQLVQNTRVPYTPLIKIRTVVVTACLTSLNNEKLRPAWFSKWMAIICLTVSNRCLHYGNRASSSKQNLLSIQINFRLEKTNINVSKADVSTARF